MQLSDTAIFAWIVLVLFLFMIIKNVNSRSILKRTAKSEKVLVEHKDTRGWVKFWKIFALVLILPILYWAYVYISTHQDEPILETIPIFLVMISACCFYGFGNFDSWEWLITENGVYTQIGGKLIPWNELITSGVTNKAVMKKERMHAKGRHYTPKEADYNKRISVTLQIRKQKGEYFKPAYRGLGVESLEKANEYSDLIREFIHAIDRAKRYHKQKEERKVSIQKRKFYI